MPRKSDKMVLLGIALVAVVLVAVVGIFYYVSNLPSQQQIIQQPTPTQYKLTLPTVFTVNDLWKGSTMSGVSIYIYKYSNKEELEHGTVANTYTTTNPLTSGDRYWIKLSKTDSGSTWFKYYDITIPYESSPSASNHYVTLDFYTMDTSYGIKVYKPDGTALSSGEDYDVGTSVYPSFTVMMGPPDDDTGIMNTYDPIKTIDRQILVVINVADSSTNSSLQGSNKLIVSNIPELKSVSSTNRNFGFTVDPSKLTRDIATDGRVLSEGIHTLTLSFDASGLSAGNGAIITITLYAFSNESWYKTYGTHPPSYVQLGSFTFNVIQ
jgi:hypothetical protein